jgi:hypothetical protein
MYFGGDSFLKSYSGKISAFISLMLLENSLYSSIKILVPNLLYGHSNSESSSYCPLSSFVFFMLLAYYENFGFYKNDCRIIYYTFMSFELNKFKIIWYVTLNFDYRRSPGWSIIFIISCDSGRFPGSLHIIITVPFSSRPLLPALPDICTYSDEFKNLSPPSEPVTFLIELKMTVFVGMLIPIAKVYVANKTLIRPSENSNSTISFAKGSKSP